MDENPDADDASKVETDFKSNMLRSGELFILSLWIQAQMSDLLIFEAHPELLESFHATPKRVPDEVHKLRLVNWEGDLRVIKAAFLEAFGDRLTEADIQDLDALEAIRNAIAHSHVSIGREYFLYRPRDKSEQRVVDALQMQALPDQAEPLVVKIANHEDDQYLRAMDLIKRLDEDCLTRIAKDVGVQRGRIR